MSYDAIRLGRLSACLITVTNAPGTIEQSLSEVRRNLNVAFNEASRFVEAARALTERGDLAGEAATTALAVVLQAETAHQRIAECYMALASLPSSTDRSSEVPFALRAAAREGAIAQGLATWEADWLRESAVTALAEQGKPATP